MHLKLFWKYYGSKWSFAKNYPQPTYDTIIEPFAGGGGYSLNYADRNIILVEKYHVIAEIWKFLIKASPAEIMDLPFVASTNDLPPDVPDGAKWLIGFNLGYANCGPRITISSSYAKDEKAFRWGPKMQARIASQVPFIKHWKVIEGDYFDAPDVEATWYIDPPYQCAQGRHYKHNKMDFPALGSWCKSREGQVMVCEYAGADWLPFVPCGFTGKKKSREVIWTNENNLEAFM